MAQWATDGSFSLPSVIKRLIALIVSLLVAASEQVTAKHDVYCLVAIELNNRQLG